MKRGTSTPAVVALSLLALTGWMQPKAYGLILSTWNGVGTPASVNTTAPADDPGWANSSGGGRSAVYLGDQWVLTANHVTTGDIELPSGTYSPIPGTEIVLTNPSFFDANGNGQANGAGALSESLDSLSDIKLYRINTHPTTGLTPEQMDPNVSTIEIATETPFFMDDVTAISRGTTRKITSANPNGRYRFDSAFNLTSDLNSPNEGFLTTLIDGSPTPREKAWGTNRIANANNVGGVVNDGVNGIVRVSGLNDTIGVFTQFDRGVDNNGQPLGDGGTFDEFQGAGGDSGGPVFTKNSLDEWVLLGVMHSIYTLPNQPNFTPMYGQFTSMSDLSQPHYYNQIVDIRASDLYSVLGDIDLDGVVSGEIINGVPTGDVAALVAGWAHAQASGDIISWKNGDLNQDGITNLADFVILRDELGGSISTSSFAMLVGVPEPTSVCLALLSISVLTLNRRTR